MRNKKITINKIEAMKNFFNTYSNDIEGTLWDKEDDERQEFLTGDIFIGCASAATGIPERDFVEYSKEYLQIKITANVKQGVPQ